MNNVLYQQSMRHRVREVREFMYRDWLRTKKDICNVVKFANDYWTFLRQGMSHRAALYNARNAL